MSEETDLGIETDLNFTSTSNTSSTSSSSIFFPTSFSQQPISNSSLEIFSGEEENVTITNNYIINSSNSTLDYFNLTGGDGRGTTESTDFDITRDELEESQQQIVITQFWIGVGLSIASSVFIGVSFIIKKKALVKLSKGGRRANQGGYGYLKDFLWWSGLLAMAVGEAANFMAYTFAPASLVSTLGVLSVLVTAILSSRYLHERLNFLGKLGCFLSTIGSTVIVIHAPMEKDIESMYDLQLKLGNFVFVLYVLLTIVLSLIFIYQFRPKLPETSTYTLLIWIGVCSMIGSLSVMSVKGLGLALMQTVNGNNQFGHWLTWFCLITLIVCVSVQMNFLNKALDTFNTAVVTPIYYVFFTTCVIIASAILFNEFANLPLKDWVGLGCGFLTVLVSIFLLHLCKNFDLTFMQLTQKIDLINDSVKIAGNMDKATAMTPVREMDLTNSGRFKDDDDFDYDGEDGYEYDETDLEDLYRSCDSDGNGKLSAELTPDVKLLSVITEKGRRSKDGYIPLSYGTNDGNNGS